ncbi:MAG: hypothetical protein ACRC8Y_24385, partial [Chroococcales cyanobacterium]
WALPTYKVGSAHPTIAKYSGSWTDDVVIWNPSRDKCRGDSRIASTFIVDSQNRPKSGTHRRWIQGESRYN